jgi:acyl transferase domain-containing protein
VLYFAVAVHLACQAILVGECEMALADGGTVRVPQQVGYLSRQGDILSPDGHCRAFDAAAQARCSGAEWGGPAQGPAVAIADHDNIYAVIRGSAINNDGADKVSLYLLECGPVQTRAMVEAMSIAEISPDDIGYVECHGTGTVVGDPLEIDALTRAFRTGTDRRGFCAIASVKTNIGHLEQTAGMAALTRPRLPSSKEKSRPASISDTERQNRFPSSPFFVNTKCRKLAADRHRVRRSTRSVGGTNAFLVLDEAPRAPACHGGGSNAPNIVTLSEEPRALRASMERHELQWSSGQMLTS